ncbi:GNAT family N-acetyltransferase [Paenibacillus sp. P96]|uniref:GNAT family N-acetyltransferase n=1 Tax=Paenibacillus zeirhizosphaerae TaxID=2987519 RepID=A0ABT9FT46_9BACL|nr:GNAT family N-acetyltransferase [Paenibacillus sp. P96]MDP4097912.1 GNAT family N-acetyltransferase [Paenibacillus sp. P96]
MGIKLATEKEIHWVNEQYQYIGFVPSSLDNEKVAIVTHDEKPAGVGRIVYLNEEEAEIGGIYILNEFRGLSLAYELVDYLVQETQLDHLKKVYCLPFEELKDFYQKFGFRECDMELEQINSKVLSKYQWCLQNY